MPGGCRILRSRKTPIPGYINEGWFQVNEPGIYRGQCAELCGKDHGFMPVVVEVLPKEEYAAWLEAQSGRVTGARFGPRPTCISIHTH